MRSQPRHTKHRETTEKQMSSTTKPTIPTALLSSSAVPMCSTTSSSMPCMRPAATTHCSGCETGCAVRGVRSRGQQLQRGTGQRHPRGHLRRAGPASRAHRARRASSHGRHRRAQQALSAGVHTAALHQRARSRRLPSTRHIRRPQDPPVALARCRSLAHRARKGQGGPRRPRRGPRRRYERGPSTYASTPATSTTNTTSRS